MGRPSAQQARDTRREILDAALDLFAEHGFHGTSMRALATAVGVRESALYHYFPSKTALLSGVVGDYALAQSTRIEADFKAAMERPLEEILTLFAQRLVATLQSPRYQKLLRIMVVSRAEFDEDEDAWRQIADEPRKVLLRIFQQLRRAGKIRDDVDVEVFRLHFVAPLILASDALFGGVVARAGLPLPKLVKQHVAFMARALAPGHPRGGRG